MDQRAVHRFVAIRVTVTKVDPPAPHSRRARYAGGRREDHEPIQLPIDWERWFHAKLAAAPLAPLPEEFTVPEGWPVVIVAVADGVDAVCAVLDRAVHAHATGVTTKTRAAFASAAPAWDDNIVALANL